MFCCFLFNEKFQKLKKIKKFENNKKKIGWEISSGLTWLAWLTSGAGYKAYQTLHIQWFGGRGRIKRYVYNGLGTQGTPNVAYTMVWEQTTHRTVRIQWFGNTRRTKPYIYNGLGAKDAPSVTYTIVWGHMAHQTLRIQWF